MICPNTTPSAYLEDTTISGHELYHAGTNFIEAQLKIWEEFLDQNEEEAKRIPSMFSTGWLLRKIHDERLTRLRDLCFDYSRVPQQERADIVKEFLFSGPTLPDPELLMEFDEEIRIFLTICSQPVYLGRYGFSTLDITEEDVCRDTYDEHVSSFELEPDDDEQRLTSTAADTK